MTPQQLRDQIAKDLYGMTPLEAREKAICVNCKGPAGSFKDEHSRKEYLLTAFCQECQDSFYGGPAPTPGEYED